MKKYFLIAMLVILPALVGFGCQARQDKAETPQRPAINTPQSPSDPAAGKPVELPAGKTPKDYVNDYFTAYKEQRLDDAFELQPAENKAKQPLEQFKEMRKGMPIDGFKILPEQKQGSQTIIQVEYQIPNYDGLWVSTWVFEKQGDKTIAVRYKADPKM